MDLSTLLGVGGAAGLLVLGVVSGELGRGFLNMHGLVIVFGGTIVAMLINTPLGYLKDTFVAMASLLKGETHGRPEKLIPELTRMAEQVQQGGMGTLREVNKTLAGGYVAEAATTALEYNNPEFVRSVLETEVNNRVDRDNEVINVIRTAGVISPMFGLIGTLIGIIEVLRHIDDVKVAGAAMAVAITSAFYGIVLANVVFIPVAGKLRMRLWERIKIQALVIEGVVGMMQGTVPLVLERRLEAYK